MCVELIKLCIVEINKLNKDIDRNRYKVKYSDEYYLTLIFYMLNDVNNWNFISKLKEYNSEYKYHYKTIYNKFVYWTKKDIFKNAFNNFIYTKKTNLLLTDAFSINNKFGSEEIVINPENKKKKVTKLAVVSSNDNFIHSVKNFELNKQNEKYNTAVHDVKMISKSLEEVKIQNNSKYFHLLGDKAYKTQECIKLNNKKVKIITYDKKNAKIKNSNYKNKKLEKRIKVEHVINNIKKYERVKTRKDRKIITFMSWIYMSSLINNINVTNTTKKT